MARPRMFRLKKKHAWKARPGMAICVLDRGAVRFDYPQEWVLGDDQGTVHLHDREPPDDNCELRISLFHTPPIDWSGLPLDKLLELSVVDREREELERRDIVFTERGDQQVAWVHIRYLEKKEQREACSRICLARGVGIHCLMTFVYWSDQAEKFEPVWDEMMRTLVLELYIKDPTQGPVVQ